LGSTRSTGRVNLSLFAEEAIGCKSLPDEEVTDIEVRHYKSLLNCVVSKAEDSRCNPVAIKMEDSWHQNLFMVW
jgi:hypothetical protein